jgi:hypothetical protein
MIGFKHTKETKEKLRKPKSNTENMIIAQRRRRLTENKRIWITNGVENRLIYEHEGIPEGWNHGMTTDSSPPSQKGKFWINDGSKSRMATSIPDGWKKGRIYRRKV